MIEVTTDTSAFDSSINALQKRLGDLRAVYGGIGSTLENQIRDRRETLKDPNGQRWAEWAASTIATYPEDGRRKLLDRSGALWDRTGPQWVVKGSGASLTLRVGFDKDYSTYLEFGTDTMPRRGLLFADPNTGQLGSEDELAIEDALQKWLREITG
jgi:phage gpG-like protein